MSLLRPSLVLVVVFTLITGLAYPLVVTGAAQLALPAAANGSRVIRDGVVVGSALIGQQFSADRYFHGRPSATAGSPYNAAASGGSNLAPSAATLRDAVRERVAFYGGGMVPADLVTASASGLDPDITPSGALFQADRVAAARGLPAATVKTLIAGHIRAEHDGLLGQPRVNVLALNLALDRLTE